VANSKVHAILGDLHKLLSLYRSEDFVDAGRYTGIPRPLKDVLFALAREAESAKRSDASRTPSEARSGPSVKTSAGTSGQLFDLLRQSRYFESNNSMLGYARAIGLRLQANPKDSRERVAKRLAALVEKMPPPARDKAIADLRAGQSNQTQGWVDVIKSANQ
jgi:hypothetical protein